MFRGSGTSVIGEKAFGESEHATLVNCSRCGSSGEEMFPAQITRAGSGWGRGHSPVSSLRLFFGTADEAGRTIIFSSPDFGGRSPVSLRKYNGRAIFFLLPLFCRNDERRCAPVPSLRLLFGTANEAGRTIIFSSPDFGRRSPVSSLRLLCGAAKKSDGRFSLCHDFGRRSPVPLKKYCGRVIFFVITSFLSQRKKALCARLFAASAFRHG